MKKFMILSAAMLLAGAFPAVAQDAHVSDGQAIGAIIGGGIVGLAMLFAIGHMLYVIFIRKKLRTDWTVEEFASMRAAAGFSEYASDDENQEIGNVILNQVNGWETFIDDQGEENALPLSRSNVKNSVAAYEQVVAMMPTGQDVVELLNNLGETLNGMRSRSFTASKTMLVCVVIAGLIIGFAGNWGAAITMMLLTGGLYTLSCMKPDYVLIRKELEGKEESSFLSGLIGGMLGGVAAAPTYVTVTKWSDGSTTREEDNSSFWISAILMILAIIVLIFILPIVSFINYLRNYVFA